MVNPRRVVFFRLDKRSIVYGEVYLGVNGFGDKKMRFVCIYFHSVELASLAGAIYILLSFTS